MKKILLMSAMLFAFQSMTLEEGMFPLSDLNKLDLEKAGLKIPTERIFNPTGSSLVQALVRVGGCTGSFVSEEGLIITNHHCAFGAVAAASSPENDYITEGFKAENKTQEIKTNITARITESYEDVSAKVLKGVADVDDPAIKTRLIEKNLKAIEGAEKEANPGLLIEISEMLQGKNYTLFRYKELKDIRLVYVPPRSIGEFGGETDNWVWPRHTGDFSFMRAYVAPDGKAKEYDINNVPYKPLEYLKINPNGVKENDFVFILGYPGRTFRNQPSQFLHYQNNYAMPFITEWYDFQINAMLDLGKKDKAKEIAFASRIKSLANVTKNYKGKLQGLRRTDIIEQRQKDDAEMQKLVESNPSLKAQYGNVFSGIEAVYNEKNTTAYRDMWLQQAMSSSGLLYGAGFVGYHALTYQKIADKNLKAEFIKDFKEKESRLKSRYKISDLELERRMITKLLLMGLNIPDDQKPAALKVLSNQPNASAAIQKWVDDQFAKSRFMNPENIMTQMINSPEKLLKLNDPLAVLAGEMLMMLDDYQVKEKNRQDQLTVLLPKLNELKQLYKKSLFIPDANATLRFTYGYIKGYWPNDGEYHKPFTSIAGILEKAKSEGDFFLEEFIKTLMESENPEAIVCFLYNMDTTGGNSGSPIMDSEGRLVGVNFDRAYTATINDFAWNEEYSRSIGVDIRYVLLIMKKLGKAEHLLKEMKVS